MARCTVEYLHQEIAEGRLPGLIIHFAFPRDVIQMSQVFWVPLELGIFRKGYHSMSPCAWSETDTFTKHLL